MLKRLFILFITLFLSLSIGYPGIVVLENLKTETITIKATGEGVFPNDPSMPDTQKELMAKTNIASGR